MALHKLFCTLIAISIFYLFSMLLLAQAREAVHTFIIHVDKPQGDIQDLTIFYQSFLPVTTTRDALLYLYKHTISGFSVRLTDAELQAMEKKEGFLSATPERTYRLSTTRSPSFLGLHPGMGLWNQSNQGKRVIIGLLDTGILPSHPSFRDTNMPSPPAKWKGKCEFPINTKCNNKIIGARSFLRGSNVSGPVTPIDEIGHGTHTSSTAAGGFVRDACVLGSACGTAAGMAPQAHLAMYKVCSPDGKCYNSDILAGIDAAIEDGVDVLSISLGGDSVPFYNHTMLIGLFAAVQKGIFVGCAAGNDGPFEQTLINDAPWIMTVGASTIDRSIRATAKLGNGKAFDGQSLTQPKIFSAKLLPLVYAGSSGKKDSAFCAKGSLAGVDIKGKVVLCYRSFKIRPINQSQVVKYAGGAAVILANTELQGFTIFASEHALPATEVSYADAQIIKAYINSTKSPTATILFNGTVIGDPLSPSVAHFSSRGPSEQTPGILKPDIIGPGVDILAAFPYSLDHNTKSKLTFKMDSGTSMACPHVSGVAALLKSAHPDWSPAAIKSAIMTTADLVNVGNTPILDQKHKLADVFATGAGHVNPSKAEYPGLVYDMGHDDYIPYLCGLGYTDKQVRKIVGKSVHCTSRIPQGQLNYPTFSVSLGPSQTFSRTVTNVGEPCSNYSVRISAPEGVEIVVKPCKLRFSSLNRKKTYTVTFTRSNNTTTKPYSQGYLQWVSGKKYSVRSVISVKFTDV